MRIDGADNMPVMRIDGADNIPDDFTVWPDEVCPFIIFSL